jgi:hypothetical protein
MLVIALRTNQDTKHQLAVAHPQQPVVMGTQISTGSVIAKVESVSYSDGVPGFKSPADKHYAIVKLSLTNKSDQPIHVYPVFDTYMKASDGTVFKITPFALTDAFRSGDVMPGEALKGDLSFLIPKQTDARFYLESIWSGSVVSFTVK